MGNEQTLIECAKQGDKSAYEALYRSSVGKIYALCLRMCCDENIAEDLTQEAFINGWRKIESFHSNSSFATWMYRIATNTVIDFMRSKRHWKHVDLNEEAVLMQSESFNKDVSMDIERAMDALPDQARLVFICYEFLGYQHNEIADSTGLAVGTCKAHLHRARQLMQKVLNHD